MSQHLVIGVDIDGVLANFNKAYRERLIQVTGRDLIPAVDCSGDTIGSTPPCWSYPVDHYGYTKDEDRAVWKSITEDRHFWRKIEPFARTRGFLEELYFQHDEVYFITTRPGVDVQLQSIDWLMENGYPDEPQVLIARGEKGFLAHGLGLTHFLDDKPENCFSVRQTCPNARIYMNRTRYNIHAEQVAADRRIVMIDSINQFVEDLEPCKTQ
jgi:5'(3')-deoxyribonucleotidase